MSLSPRALMLYLAVGGDESRVEVPPLLGSARVSSRRPAYVQIGVDDELVKAVKGRRDQRPLLMLLIVEPDVVRRAAEREELGQLPTVDDALSRLDLRRPEPFWRRWWQRIRSRAA